MLELNEKGRETKELMRSKRQPRGSESSTVRPYSTSPSVLFLLYHSNVLTITCLHMVLIRFESGL